MIGSSQEIGYSAIRDDIRKSKNLLITKLSRKYFSRYWYDGRWWKFLALHLKGGRGSSA
jgi:hypothetical protein